MHPCPHGGSWDENSSWIGLKIAVFFYFLKIAVKD
jgi:hypothetical protein